MDENETCPKCKQQTLVRGYGLAGGPGIGSYELCDNESCDYQHKTVDDEAK